MNSWRFSGGGTVFYQGATHQLDLPQREELREIFLFFMFDMAKGLMTSSVSIQAIVIALH